MSFRDKLSAFIADDKRDAANAVFAELDEELTSYAKDIKELKAKLRSQDGVKPEDLERIEAENAELKKQLAEAMATAKKATKERDDAAASRAEIEGQINRSTAEAELRKQLSALGIQGDRLEELVEGYIPRTTVKIVEGVRVAHIGDKSAAEYFPEWAKARGKEFIPAAAAAGAGAIGIRGQAAPMGLETQYADAQRRGDVASMMALKEAMLREK